MDLNSAFEAVRDFHVRHGYAVDVDLGNDSLFHGEVTNLMRMYGMHLIGTTKSLQEKANDHLAGGDPRLYRACLEMEELGEKMIAMADRNIEKILDGAADQLYVLVGMHVDHGLPIAEPFEEVVVSNRTKRPRGVDEDPRLRDKGEDYVPPNLKQFELEYLANGP